MTSSCVEKQEPAKIAEAGLYADVSTETYHADPCPEPSLSSSIAKLMLARSPAHARLAHPRLNPEQREETGDRLDFGSVAHALMLGDDRGVCVVEADSYRTKAAKDQRDEARANGQIPVLADKYERALAMVAAGRAQLDRHEEAWEAFKSGYGKAEQTLIWRDGPESGRIWCRARIDWLPNNGNVIWDYKTTGAGADPDNWVRTMLNTGGDIQAGFYRRGVEKQLGIEAPHFRFVVQETEAPYALAVHELDPHFLGVAFRKADAAVENWSWCLRHDRWPGYAGRVHYLECPPWEANRWEDRDQEQGDRSSLLETSLRWQAPDAATGQAVVEHFCQGDAP